MTIKLSKLFVRHVSSINNLFNHRNNKLKVEKAVSSNRDTCAAITLIRYASYQCLGFSTIDQ